MTHGRVRFVTSLLILRAVDIDLDLLRVAIARSWWVDTTDDPAHWTPENPSMGQCAVTSLAVRDYLGGDVRLAWVLRDGEQVDMHCWNELSDGTFLDFTADQFSYEYELGEPLDLQPIVDETGVDRHALLAGRIAAELELLAASR